MLTMRQLCRIVLCAVVASLPAAGCGSTDTPLTQEEHAREVRSVLEALDQDPKDVTARQRAAELNALADRQNGLLYSTSSTAGTQVAFFEFADGLGWGARETSQSGETVLEGARTIREMFERARPGEVLPSELAALESRIARGTLEAQPVETELQPDTGSPVLEFSPAEKHATSDCGHFLSGDGVGCPPAADGDGSYCLCNVGVTWTYGSSGDLHTHAFYRIDSYLGSVSVELAISLKNQPKGNWGYVSLQGNNTAYWLTSGTSNGAHVRSKLSTRVSTVMSVREYHLGGCMDRETQSSGWDCP